MTVADFIVLLSRSSCCCWLCCGGCFCTEKEIAPSPPSPLSCAQRGQGGCRGWEIDAGALYRALGGGGVHRNEARSSLFQSGA